jgi:segregation and condensation protein A
MLYEVQLTNYQGPLDLLLNLIEKNKLDITEVSLSKVTDDYLNYLEKNDIESEQINGFLEIALKLVYIKSQALLPVIESVDDEDETETADLAYRLEQYRQFKNLGKEISILNQAPLFCRPYQKDIYDKKPKNMSPRLIQNTMQRLLTQKAEMDKPVELKLKGTNTTNYLKVLRNKINNSKTNLQSLLDQAKDEEEKILFFLATLELIKKCEVIFTKSSSDYLLRKT